MRINKYLSGVGVCSRRQADELINQGRVLINGSPAQNGMQVEEGDEILVDGKPLQDTPHENKPVLLLFHKPKGLVCTEKAQGNQQTVIDHIHYPSRIFTVGRLDKESEGLLLLTNQGDLVNAMMRSRNGHEKQYRVTVNKPITQEFLKSMAEGIYLEELQVKTRPCKIRQLSEKTFSVILTQGLNRQIRRMCQVCDYRVERLVRTRVMNLKLDGISSGKWRDATEEEIKQLRRMLKKDI